VRRALAACALAGVIAGCGGDDVPGTKSAARTATHDRTGASPAPATRTEPSGRSAPGDGSFDPGAIYRLRAPGVVTVLALNGDSATNALGRESLAVGSGFVTGHDGYITTNAHVVTSGGQRRSDRIYAEFADGNRLAARVVGLDLNSDLALLKIDPAKLRGGAGELDVLPLGSTKGLRVGDPVAAIGSPFGEEQSLSVGVVSALNRDIESLTRYQIGNAIQTDAAINHGNSGGPLLDSRGRVIGVNQQIRTTGGGGEGVGFAIPVETVKRSIAQLREKGRVDYAYVGITSVPLYPQLAERIGVRVARGAIIDEIRPGSPADRAGLRAARERGEFQGQAEVPLDGDVIVSVDGRRLDDATDVSDAIGLHEPGDVVRFVIVRDGKRRTVSVRLGTRPSSQSD
jgi:2-alkenal reductase